MSLEYFKYGFCLFLVVTCSLRLFCRDYLTIINCGIRREELWIVLWLLLAIVSYWNDSMNISLVNEENNLCLRGERRVLVGWIWILGSFLLPCLVMDLFLAQQIKRKKKICESMTVNIDWLSCRMWSWGILLYPFIIIHASPASPEYSNEMLELSKSRKSGRGFGLMFG